MEENVRRLGKRAQEDLAAKDNRVGEAVERAVWKRADETALICSSWVPTRGVAKDEDVEWEMQPAAVFQPTALCTQQRIQGELEDDVDHPHVELPSIWDQWTTDDDTLLSSRGSPDPAENRDRESQREGGGSSYRSTQQDILQSTPLEWPPSFRPHLVRRRSQGAMGSQDEDEPSTNRQRPC